MHEQFVQHLLAALAPSTLQADYTMTLHTPLRRTQIGRPSYAGGRKRRKSGIIEFNHVLEYNMSFVSQFCGVQKKHSVVDLKKSAAEGASRGTPATASSATLGTASRLKWWPEAG